MGFIQHQWSQTWVVRLDLCGWNCVLWLYVFACMPERNYWIISCPSGIIYKRWKGIWLRSLSKCAEDCFGCGTFTYEFVEGEIFQPSYRLTIKNGCGKIWRDSCRVRLQSDSVFFILSLVNDNPCYGGLDWGVRETEEYLCFNVALLFFCNGCISGCFWEICGGEKRAEALSLFPPHQVCLMSVHLHVPFAKHRPSPPLLDPAPQDYL